MKFFSWTVVLSIVPLTLVAGEPLFENNFESAEIGNVPDEMIVQDGQFTVRLEGTNKFLELPGAPLETFGVLFGPSDMTNVTVSIKVFGNSKGRRFPTFAVGAYGLNAYKLQVSPAKRLMELYKGEQVVKSVPYEWTSGEWTELQLEVRQREGKCHVLGRAATVGQAMPEWMIAFDDDAPPAPGLASLWGSPFSGMPIRFDDLVVRAPVDPKLNSK